MSEYKHKGPLDNYLELTCPICKDVIGIIRLFRKYYKQPIPEFCHSQKLPYMIKHDH